MIKIEKFAGDGPEWNSQLAGCINSNIFSTHEWLIYKSKSWHPERFVFRINNDFIGQSLIFFRNFGAWRLGWCPGGINSIDPRYLTDITNALATSNFLSRTYIRFCFKDRLTGALAFSLNQCPTIYSPKRSINSGYTIQFTDELKTSLNYSKNNRYYLKKAVQQNLSASIGDADLDVFCRIHDEMCNIKGQHNIKVDRMDLENLCHAWGKKILMATVFDGPICISAALLISHANSIYYYLAAANEIGRRKSASFLMVDTILKYAQSNLISAFDFGGVTPFDPGAEGVNRFKLGFGGEIINYAGEWVLCDSELLAFICDKIIDLKIRN
jgi:hypothetical protein